MNEQEQKLLELLDRQIELNEGKNRILQGHYEDMKDFAHKYSLLAAQLMGVHLQQNSEGFAEPDTHEEEDDPGLRGGELSG